MKKSLLLKKISSKYIIDSVFAFIKDENYKYKLIHHSKCLQDKLNIKLIDYQIKYFNRNGINFHNFLYKTINEDIFDKDQLKNKLEEYLLYKKIKINSIQNIVLNFFEENEKIYQKNFYTNNNYLLIDINSPFFNILSKSKIFQYFTITICSLDKFEKDYISAFKEMNKLNSNYSSIILDYRDTSDINLKKININFDKIKKLKIIQNSSFEFNGLFNTIFTLGNPGNNLCYLNLTRNFKNQEIEPNTVTNLNNFKSLKYLYLNGFNFKRNFVLKLDNLESLVIMNSKNIIFTEKNSLYLKNLELFFNTNVKPISILKIPELEECQLCSRESFKEVIDFSSLKKVKNLKIELKNFILFDKSYLISNLEVFSNSHEPKENELKMWSNIFELKLLRDISLSIYKLGIDSINEIKGENESINTMNLHMYYIKDCVLYDFQKRFPNLSNLYIHYINNEGKTNIEIRENKKSKINRINLYIKGNGNIVFLIHNYETLEAADFCFLNEIENFEKIFPIFQNKCNICFKSLNEFKLIYKDSNTNKVDILNNIYQNLDCMPCLKRFTLSLNQFSLDEKKYLDFIKKILSLKLEFIKLDYINDGMNKNYYSFKELKDIAPVINARDFQNISIKKWVPYDVSLIS